MDDAGEDDGRETGPHGRFPSRGSRDEALTRLLKREDCIVTAALHELGYSEKEIRGLVSHRDLLRLHRGVYVDGRTRTGPWTRLTAALLAVDDPSAFLSHRTGAAARDYRAINVRDIHVTVVADRTPQIAGLKLHRCVTEPDRGEVSTVLKLRVATLPRILVELAATARPEELDELITAGERRKALDNMASILTRHAHRRGIVALRNALAGHITLPDGNSGLERAVWAWYFAQPDLPAPDETNVRIGPYEFDGVWHRQHMILEIDSRTYHQARADMEKDRIKDTYVQTLGYRIIRVTDFRFTNDRPGVRRDLLALLALAA